MRYVTDPRTGIATNPVADPDTGRTWRGIPEPWAVRLACERHYGPVRRAEAAKAQADQQLEEREKILAARDAPRPTIAEMKAKYGENWGLTPREERKTNYRPLTEEELRQHYRKHDLGREPKKGEAA
jgi:hypothetical protein